MNTSNLAEGSENRERQETIHSQDLHKVEKSFVPPPRELFQRWYSGVKYELVIGAWELAEVT